MAYRDPELSLDDLNPTEQLAFGGLLRALVSADGTFTPEEHAVLRDLAAELGEEGFWTMMERASEEVEDDAHAKRLAREVERQPVRDLIFGSLYETGQAGTLSQAEMAMLEELRALWNVVDRPLKE